MSERAKKYGATYDDVVAAPDDVIAELVSGSLWTSPRPRPRHIHVTSVLGGLLSDPFHRGVRGPGGWWILIEPEVHLWENVFVPDIAGWRRDRLAGLPDAPGITVIPDWICEVLSPSTEEFDRRTKMPLYGYAGVGHMWLVDPNARRLDAFEFQEGSWTRIESHGGDGLIRVPPFDAIEIDLASIWA